MENNILNSAVLLLPGGGAPDQMIHVLKITFEEDSKELSRHDYRI